MKTPTAIKERYMAIQCKHPIDRLSYQGTSTEDAAVGSRWPVKVHWYLCGVCGSEIPGAAPGTERVTIEADDFPERDYNEPF